MVLNNENEAMKQAERNLPKHVYPTGRINRPFKVCIRRNGRMIYNKAFATLNQAAKQAGKIERAKQAPVL